MPVNAVPTLGWTRRSAAVTLLLVTQEQKREVAARIAGLMDAQNLNIPKLARRAELSEKTISRMLNAKHEPRIDTLERIAKALGVPESELRGPAPAPLGLGAETQLDRIEQRLDQLQTLMERLAGEEIVEAVQQALRQAAEPDVVKRRRRAA